MQINEQAGCHQTQSGNEDRTYSSRSQDSVLPFWPSRVSSLNGAERGIWRCGLFTRFVDLFLYPFTLQQLKKAFCNCIIVAVTAMAHADFNSM